MISLFAGAMIAIGALVVGFWLWFGMENYHMFWYAGPLASAGYDGNIDNLFKCSVLFAYTLFVLVPDMSALSYYTLFIAVVALAAARSLFIWRS